LLTAKLHSCYAKESNSEILERYKSELESESDILPPTNPGLKFKISIPRLHTCYVLCFDRHCFQTLFSLPNICNALLSSWGIADNCLTNCRKL